MSFLTLQYQRNILIFQSQLEKLNHHGLLKLFEHQLIIANKNEVINIKTHN
jgi:hypothetical protein